MDNFTIFLFLIFHTDIYPPHPTPPKSGKAALIQSPALMTIPDLAAHYVARSQILTISIRINVPLRAEGGEAEAEEEEIQK